MKKRLGSGDSHPILTNIIGSVVGAVVGPLIITLIPGAWTFLAGCVTASYLWINHDHPIQGWIFIVLILCALLVIYGFVLNLKPTNRQPEWKTYRSDSLFGLSWQWDYYGQEIISLACLCPDCAMQVYPQNRAAFRAVDRIGFYCDHCQQDLGEHAESWEHFEDKVRRSIQRKLRTAEWQRTNARQQ